MKLTFFPSAAALRRWFAAHHDREPELMVGFFKKSSRRPSVIYHEALDEALCVGWIDGVRRSLGADAYTIRFTPRNEKSIWSQVNIARARQLVAGGRMTAAGRRAFDMRDERRAKLYSYERESARFDSDLERTFKADRPARTSFRRSRPGTGES